MPNVNFFRRDSIEVIRERCQILDAKKALIITDKFLNSLEGGPVDKVIKSLEIVRIDHTFYDSSESNLKDKNAEACLEIYQAEACGLILTVGGGSVRDCGKGIGIFASHEDDLYENYVAIETLSKPLTPIAFINTTVGTLNELTHYFVITNTEKKLILLL